MTRGALKVRQDRFVRAFSALINLFTITSPDVSGLATLFVPLRGISK